MWQVGGYPHSIDSMTVERGGFLVPLYTAYKITNKYKIIQWAIIMHIDIVKSYTNRNLPKKGTGTIRHLTDDYHLKLFKQNSIGCLQDHNIQIH